MSKELFLIKTRSTKMGVLMENMITFLKTNREVIIQRWMSLIEQQFNNLDTKSGDLLFYADLIADLDIPLESHPAYQHIEAWSKMLVEQNVTLIHVFFTTHFWRRSVFEMLQERHENSLVAIEPLTKIIERLDIIERCVIHFYTEQTNHILEQKENTTELHEDRLNIIGKMAASMAHELRNPLTAIGGFLKLIRSTLPDESLQKVNGYLDVVQNEFDNFQMQITGFLSFSKKPFMEESFANLSLRQLINYVVTLISPRINYENIYFELDCSEEIIVSVQRMAIQQVISNIFNNSIDALTAVSYNKKIKILAYEDESYIYLNISNNGPKIPEDLSDTLFSPFVSGKEDGTGLGLAICKQIMLKNNGEISFSSTDQETTFMLTFEKSLKQKSSI